MITISSYNGSSASAENNSKKVSIGGTTFFFSYETLVAVRDINGLKVTQNVWKQTTGKHLNIIDGGSKESKAKRLPYDDFKNYVASLAISQCLQALKS